MRRLGAQGQEPPPVGDELDALFAASSAEHRPDQLAAVEHVEEVRQRDGEGRKADGVAGRRLAAGRRRSCSTQISCVACIPGLCNASW